MNRKIAIIGGGIGGLTAAAFLQKSGQDVVVFEQAAELKEVGAGTGLWCNATYYLSKLSITQEFWDSVATPIDSLEIATPEGLALPKVSISDIKLPDEQKSYIVHRNDLHRALVERVGLDSIQTGHRLACLQETESGVELQFENGNTTHADVVIGADGLRSRVRSSLFGEEPPSYSGQVCYRGIAKIASESPGLIREIQGKGLRASVLALGKDQVYWWATRCCPEDESHPMERRQEDLLKWFSDWPYQVPEAIAATDPTQILRNNLYDRPPIPKWYTNRVCLIGDAAHPTTPNFGQGACLAIEDAALISELLEKQSEPVRAFAEFQNLRSKRCYDIVKQSRLFGDIGALASPLLVQLRNWMIRLSPSAITRRALQKQISYRHSIKH